MMSALIGKQAMQSMSSSIQTAEINNPYQPSCFGGIK
jgi:hypothetical protein